MARIHYVRRAAIAALLCSSLLTGAALAQTGGGNGATVEGGNAVAGAVREFNRNATTTDPVARPRFKAQLISFHANDETGVDALGADEIFAVIDTDAYHVATQVYEDIDTDETQRLSPRANCIYPAVDPDRSYNHRWRCDNGGAVGGMAFTITLYETDGATPFSSGACIAPDGTTDLMARHEDAVCSAQSYQSVFSHRRVFTESALANLLTAPYQFRDYTQEGDAYSVTYRITRLPDLIVQQDRALER